MTATRKYLRRTGSKTKTKTKTVSKILSDYQKKQTKKRKKAIIKLEKIIDGSKECSICQQQGARFKTKCNHYFHKKCLKNWCKSKIKECSCPNCRKILDEKNFMVYFK